jgi:hypothetical protein
MTSVIRIAVLAALVLSVVSPLRADEIKAGDLVITQAWSRATPGGAKVGGGFLTIENKGTAPDRLVGVTSDAAGKVEVHEMSMANGVMTMRPVEGGLTIAPGKTVTLAPAGFHLMLLDLKAPLVQGQSVPATLTFEKAGPVKISLDVLGVGAKGPGAPKSDGMMQGPDHSGHAGMKM